MPISTQSQLPSLSPYRVSLLRSLLKLSPEERNALLAEHCVILSQESTSESDEMEWAEEYIESEQWDTIDFLQKSGTGNREQKPIKPNKTEK